MMHTPALRGALLGLCVITLAGSGCGGTSETPLHIGETATPAPEVTTPAAPAPLVELGPLPQDSVYLLPIEAVDQDGATAALDRHRGHPVILSMFYASCPTACPMLINDVKAFLVTLTEAERAEVRVVLVSLDPARDDPPALRAAMERHGLDPAAWTLLRTAPGDVRAVAAALGVQYRSAPGGQMNHSTILTLLDPDGRPLARHEGLGRDPAQLRSALRALPASPSSR